MPNTDMVWVYHKTGRRYPYNVMSSLPGEPSLMYGVHAQLNNGGTVLLDYISLDEANNKPSEWFYADTNIVFPYSLFDEISALMKMRIFYHVNKLLFVTILFV